MTIANPNPILRPFALSFAAGAARAVMGAVRRPAALALAVAAPMVLAPAVSAQSYDYPENAEYGEHYEWESGEGWHEEEWYDPTDWFDDQPYNYEYDYDYGYDAYDDDGYDYYDDYGDDDSTYGWYNEDSYEYEDTWYDAYDDYGSQYDANDNADVTYDIYGTNDSSYGYGDSYYDNYYDGYYDGFYDDAFGIDSWNTASGYTSGYYDGFYDAQTEFEYEPTYYILTENKDRNDNTNRQRFGDDTRKRGDRAQRQSMQRDTSQRSGGMTRDRSWQGQGQASNRSNGMRDDRREMRRSDRMSGQSRAEKTSRTGTVQSISGVSSDQRPADNTVLRIKMQDGRSVTADFGPRLGRQELPFAQGDRITLTGANMSNQGREVLVVDKINLGDRAITVRSSQQRSNRMRQGDMRRDMQPRQNQGRQGWWGQNQSRQNQAGQRSMRDNGMQSGSNASDRSQEVALSGNLRNIQRIGQSGNFQILRVDMNGRSRTLAATADQASRLRDRAGESVRLMGKWDQVDGREVIKLNSLRRSD
jgi:hypothetical protein